MRELEIKPGWIVQDNNLLACSDDHIELVFTMLEKQPKAAVFSGGLDSGLLRKWHVDRLRDMRVSELWFACDRSNSLDSLKRVMDMVGCFPQDKRRCYVMVGFSGESLEEAEGRLESVYAMGFLPFAQLYRSESDRVPDAGYSSEWKALARKWSRPAAYRSKRRISDREGIF